MTTALEESERSASRPGRSLPPEKPRYPLYRRLGGPQGRSGQVRKPPPPRYPRTVKPVTSRDTDYATGPTYFVWPLEYIIKKLPVPMKRAIIILTKTKSRNALLHMILICTSIYLTSVLRETFLILGACHSDTIFTKTRMRGTVVIF
jgi:hypothetical protein